MSSLILCGFKASGKTTLGRALAAKSGRPFIDTDGLIAPDCRALWREIGESEFRKREREVVANLKPRELSIIATGGGTPLEPLQSLGLIIHVATPLEVCWERIQRQGLPSFIDSYEAFRCLFDQRREYYRTVSDMEWMGIPLPSKSRLGAC